jgi:hypothetical protein
MVMVSGAATAAVVRAGRDIFLETKFRSASDFAKANREVIWGWKRDVGASFRAVYFSGELARLGDSMVLRKWFFFYRHRAPLADIQCINRTFTESDGLRSNMTRRILRSSADRQLGDLRVELGQPSVTDKDRIWRLQLRRPRKRIDVHELPAPCQTIDAAQVFPCDLYVGSGLSYEAGLPTLCDMHQIFGVDTADGHEFTVGPGDNLPGRLAADLPGTLASFCQVHTRALAAEPTFAMQMIRQLHDSGIVRRVFTDNIDNLLAKVGVPFERTRGSGVFNERYPATFDSDRLIVIGVAADRRMLVAQARRHGIKICIVNPCEKVAPNVRHLDYVQNEDSFFRTTAHHFFHTVDSLLTKNAGIDASTSLTTAPPGRDHRERAHRSR